MCFHDQREAQRFNVRASIRRRGNDSAVGIQENPEKRWWFDWPLCGHGMGGRHRRVAEAHGAKSQTNMQMQSNQLPESAQGAVGNNKKGASCRRMAF